MKRTSKSKSINAQLLWLISAILSGTILVIFFSTNMILEKFQRDNDNQALQRSELLVKSLITTRLMDFKDKAELVGELPTMSELIAGGNAEAISAAAKIYQAKMRAPIFDILNRKGEVLASQDKQPSASDSMISKLTAKILAQGPLYTIYPRAGKLVLLGGAPIGSKEQAKGVLLLGSELDEDFAGTIRGFTKTEITFFIGQDMQATSLPALEQGRLKFLFPKEVQPLEENTKDGYLEFSSYAIRVQPNLKNGRANFKDLDAYAVRRQTLRDNDGAVLGSAIIMMPLADDQRMLFILKVALGSIAAVVFLAACGVSYRYSTSFTKPIADAIAFAQKLAAGDRDTPIKITRDDELGRLQESLEKMRVSLKELIENMDAKIKEGIRHVTNILDNLDGGFLIFDKQGVIQPGYSRVSEEYFGKNLNGKKLEEILCIEESVWPNIEGWRKILFDGVLNFKDCTPLGPESFQKLQNRYIELSYRPIHAADKSLEGVVLIATDKTRERELLRRFQLEKDRVDMIIKITTNREAFIDFIRESKNFVDDLRTHVEKAANGGLDIDSTYRTVHTLKGNSAMYGCSQIRSISHELESDLSGLKTSHPSQVQEYIPKLVEGAGALQVAINKVLDDNKALIGDAGSTSADIRRMAVSNRMLTEMESLLLQSFAKESLVYRVFVEGFVLEPLMPALKPYEATAKDIAERRGKFINDFIWEGAEIKVRLSAYKRLIAALLHAYRNAVDHGIEMPDVREEAGKPEEGQITVSLEKIEEEGSLVIRIKDDGKGIDPEVIRSKIVEKGLIDAKAAAALSEKDVIQYIFVNGFSTAEQVTDISGRGVGMDAIAYEAKKLGGRAWVESEKGKGTELTISVPFIASLEASSTPAEAPAKIAASVN